MPIQHPAPHRRVADRDNQFMRIIFVVCSVSIQLCCAPIVVAQESATGDKEAEKVAEAEGTIRGLFTTHELPALWAGRYDLAEDGESLRKREFVFGVRKLGTEQPAQLADKVHLGSCTKAMTALLTAQLVSTDRSISWNTTLGEALPDHEPLAESDWAGIRVIDILRHRSGLPANAPWHVLQNGSPEDIVAARVAMVDWLVKQTPPKKPKFLYSNVGYALLGHILETKAGKSWEEIIQERLFQPLGITEAGFGPPTQPDGEKSDGKSSQETPQPWGHHVEPGVANALVKLFAPKAAKLVPVQADNARPLGPAGRVHMPIADWAKFLQLFLHESAPKQIKGLSDADWNVLKETGDEGSYAGGWLVAERGWAGGKALAHSGSNTMWHCIAWLAPNRDFFVVAATNCHKDDVPQALDSTVAELIRRF